MVSTSAPRGRGRKGSVPTRHRKQSEPITTRVEMNISSCGSVILQSSSFDHSTLYLVPPPTYPAPMNVLQSPMYENQSYGPFTVDMLHTITGSLQMCINHCFLVLHRSNNLCLHYILVKLLLLETLLSVLGVTTEFATT